MIFEVQISEQADNDLREIYEYIAFELRSPDNAAKQLDRLEKAICNLSNFPEKYRRYQNEPWYSRGLRLFPVDNYLVFYIPNNDARIITVIRVMYGGRDIPNVLDDTVD